MEQPDGDAHFALILAVFFKNSMSPGFAHEVAPRSVALTRESLSHVQLEVSAQSKVKSAEQANVFAVVAVVAVVVVAVLVLVVVVVVVEVDPVVDPVVATVLAPLSESALNCMKSLLPSVENLTYSNRGGGTAAVDDNTPKGRYGNP